MAELGDFIDSSTLADEFMTAIEELRSRNQWVGWKLVTRPGASKATKPPVNPHNGHAASSTNRLTWGSYKQAKMAEKRYGLAGVGFVLCNEDDYTGIDLDKCRNAETGEIDQWAKEIIDSAETYCEVSPSGTGIRMIANRKVPKAIKNDVAHVEIYGTDRYLTITGNHIEGTPLDIREAPNTIAALIARVDAFKLNDAEKAQDAAPSRKQSTSSAHRSNDTGARAWAAKKLEAQVEELAATGAGGRNNRLNDAAYTLGRVIARGWIDEASVRAALEDACRQNGYWKDKGPKATRDTINSGLRAGLAEPHEDLPDHDDEDLEAEEIGNRLAEGNMARGEKTRDRKRVFVDGVGIDPETGEVIGEAAHTNDNDAGHGGAADAKEESPHAEEANRQNAGSKKDVNVEIVVASSFAGKPVPPREWHVKGLIPKDNVTSLNGDGGTGKSLLALQLAVATATNGCWIGFRPKAGKVLFISAEDEIEELHRRLASICPRLEMLENLAIVPLAGKDAILAAPEGSNGLLKETLLFKAIRHIIAEHRPDLLVLDTLADLFGGDEIKKVQARQFIAMLRGLALEYGVTVLLLSHPSQSGISSGTGTSGNTAWNNSVRSRLYFERRIIKEGGASVEEDTNIRVSKTMKSNRAAIGGKIVVRYDKGMFVREEESMLNARDAAHHAERVFMKLLAQFEREDRPVSDKAGANYAPAMFSKHQNSEGLQKRDFERAMNHLFEAGRIKVEETGPQSRTRRKLTLASAPVDDVDYTVDDESDYTDD